MDPWKGEKSSGDIHSTYWVGIFENIYLWKVISFRYAHDNFMPKPTLSLWMKAGRSTAWLAIFPSWSFIKASLQKPLLFHPLFIPRLIFFFSFNIILSCNDLQFSKQKQNQKHLLNTYYVADTLLNGLYGLIYLTRSLNFKWALSFSWRNWGFETLSNLPKVTNLESGRVGIWSK